MCYLTTVLSCFWLDGSEVDQQGKNWSQRKACIYTLVSGPQWITNSRRHWTYIWYLSCFLSTFWYTFFFFQSPSISVKQKPEEDPENLQHVKDGKWKLKYTVLIITNLKCIKCHWYFLYFMCCFYDPLLQDIKIF